MDAVLKKSKQHVANQQKLTEEALAYKSKVHSRCMALSSLLLALSLLLLFPLLLPRAFFGTTWLFLRCCFSRFSVVPSSVHIHNRFSSSSLLTGSLLLLIAHLLLITECPRLCSMMW